MMTTDNRNQQNQQDQSRQADRSSQNENIGQEGSRKNVASQEEPFENPQQGDKWDNYRTRTLSEGEEYTDTDRTETKDREK